MDWEFWRCMDKINLTKSKLQEEVVILKTILNKKIVNLIMIFTQYVFSERIVFVNESSLVYIYIYILRMIFTCILMVIDAKTMWVHCDHSKIWNKVIFGNLKHKIIILPLMLKQWKINGCEKQCYQWSYFNLNLCLSLSF